LAFRRFFASLSDPTKMSTLSNGSSAQSPPANPPTGFKLRSVLQSIGAGQGQGLDNQSFSPAFEAPIAASSREAAPFPKLMVEPEAVDETQQPGPEDLLHSTIESAKQIQQLAQRLDRRESELDQREQQLDNEQQRLSAATKSNDASLDRRWNQLQQQAAQVRLQQQHVMQLQSDIVGSYEAAKVAIESGITTEGVNRQLLEDLKQLQYELGPRFDYISRRWQYLYRLLENQRLELNAAEGNIDRVDWLAD
jgi:flagellar biosynthesis GTPase FlhF